MDTKVLFGAMVCYVLCIATSEASHFRGGTVSLSHVTTNGSIVQIKIDYRFAWRRTTRTPYCDDDIIADRTEVYKYDGSWSTSGTYSFYTANSKTSIICTAYDVNENWAYGYNSYFAQITDSQGPFTISYNGFAWTSGLYQSLGNSWRLPATIDLGIRSDTNQVNHPPSTFSSPIIPLQQGCAETIQIYYVDADNDKVKCRYATNTGIDECGGICHSGYSHFTLDENACTIHYDGLGGNYDVPVALMLEDFPASSISLGSRNYASSDPLSSIPLQFIVKISPTTICNVVPTYPPSSIPNNMNFTISVSGFLNETIYAYPSGANDSITQFVILGPLGAEVSPIYSSDGRLYSSNIMWTPSASQVGKHIICFYAIDSAGKTGAQICFNVQVTVNASLCGIANGGCSDVCYEISSVRSCSCSLACWGLLGDGATCSPQMDVVCDGSSIQISMDQCASNRTVVAGSNVTLNECQSVVSDSKHKLQFSPGQCDVSVWTSPVNLLYAISVWVWQDKYTGSSIITRGEWRLIPVTCSLSFNANVNASFIPQLPINSEFLPQEVLIEGMGQFSFFFDFYKDSSYSTTVGPEDLPMKINVNDRIYFSLGAVGSVALLMFVDECTASTKDSSGQSTISYSFILNGCFLDATLQNHSSPSAMEKRFSVEAFQFEQKLLSSHEDSEISLQCQVMLCDASNSSTRCFQGCLPAAQRRKRSLHGDTETRMLNEVRNSGGDDDDDDGAQPLTKVESPLQAANTRFILVFNDSTGSTVIYLTQSVDYTKWIIVGIGIVVVVLLLLIFVVCYHHSHVAPKRKIGIMKMPHSNDLEIFDL